MAKHTYVSPPYEVYNISKPPEGSIFWSAEEEDHRRLYTKRHILYCGIYRGMWSPPSPRSSVALPAIPPY